MAARAERHFDVVVEGSDVGAWGYGAHAPDRAETTSVDPALRQTTPLMRFALGLGTGLTFLAGLPLFLLPGSTDDWFAWTIGAGSAATVIGAFYWTACVLSFLSWRRQPWVRARVGVPGITMFLWATLVTTLLHLEAFHFSGASITGETAAWAWVVIYVADPIIVTVALAQQWRLSGSDPARSERLPGAYRRALWLAGSLFLLLGTVMLLTPSVVIDRAPFPLTNLTARTIGSWVLAMGGVSATMAWEDDRDRIRPGAVAALVAPVLLGVAMLRFRGEFTFGVSGWVYVALLALLAVLGAAGLTTRPQRQPPSG